MPNELAGWYIDDGPPSWNANRKTFSFFLHKAGHERVPCVLTLDVLEKAVPSHDFSESVLIQLFDAHRQMIELRAAQKLNAGLRNADGVVLIVGGDI
jgi:hypothetical protein